MKKVLVAGIVAAVAAGFVMSNSGRSQVQADQADLMKRKLIDSQRLLEGLALEDFQAIGESAKQLSQLSLEAQWTEATSPLYGKFGTEFRNSADRIVRSADERNIDGAALNYVQLVMACVHCHKAVRGTEDLASMPESRFQVPGD